MNIRGQARETITSIDFCLDDIGKMDWLCYFPNIRELTLACQGIQEIEVSRHFQTVWSILGNWALQDARKNLANGQHHRGHKLRQQASLDSPALPEYKQNQKDQGPG